MKKKNIKLYIVIALFFSILIIPLTYSKYTETLSKYITLNSREPNYTVVFNANNPQGTTVSGTMSDQSFTYGTPQNLNTNDYVINDYSFSSWNTSADGSGTSYEDEESVNNLTDRDGATVNLYAIWASGVAGINGVFYNSLQAALDAVPTDGTPTVVTLYRNTSENVTIDAGQNVLLNLNNKTLSNDGNANVIKNYGSLDLYGGTVSSAAATNGAINNYSSGTFIMSSGSVIMTGDRQALYNDGGNATITGTAYLSSSASARAAVHNLNSGTLTITGGTIVSTGYYGVLSANGTFTVGVKDGNIDITSPVIQAVNNGIQSNGNYSFYDGIVKSKANPFNQLNKITDKEDGYGFINSTEIIDGETYNTARLGITKTVRFNANGGSVSETIRYIEENHEIGSLPTPVRSGYIFDGWFDARTGGTQFNEHTVITADIELFAHWTKTANVAEINGTIYATLQEAINAASSGATITLLEDVSEELKVVSGTNITIDLNGKTITNSGSKNVIVNNGNLTLTNGNINTTANQGAINQVAGTLVIDSVQITATSDRQAIYITGGTTTITGNSYLSSKTYGAPTTGDTTMDRATVQVVSGTVIIESGTIVGINQHAVSNEGTLIIGTQDQNIDATSPVLMGKVNGVKSTGTLNFYDGIIKGQTATIDGTVTTQETNSQLVPGTETISGSTYNTVHLELTN